MSAAIRGTMTYIGPPIGYRAASAGAAAGTSHDWIQRMSGWPRGTAGIGAFGWPMAIGATGT